MNHTRFADWVTSWAQHIKAESIPRLLLPYPFLIRKRYLFTVEFKERVFQSIAG